MASSFFQQFGRAKLVATIFPVLWIVSAFGFFRVTIFPCARSTISYLVVSRLPSCHWIAGIKAWLSPAPCIYIVLIILAIASQNRHLLKVPSRKTKAKQIAEKISEEKEESSDFSTDHHRSLAAIAPSVPEAAVVEFPEARTDQENKLGDEKTDEDGEPVLDTLEEAWKMIMEAQGKKAC